MPEELKLYLNENKIHLGELRKLLENFLGPNSFVINNDYHGKIVVLINRYPKELGPKWFKQVLYR